MSKDTFESRVQPDGPSKLLVPYCTCTCSYGVTLPLPVPVPVLCDSDIGLVGGRNRNGGLFTLSESHDNVLPTRSTPGP